uniref:Chitin-binding type-4 domain-containing protein n=1 Tax=Chrysotila carterae TaxID=13221 RepID=A0A7S4B7Q2_CHRCT
MLSVCASLSFLNLCLQGCSIGCPACDNVTQHSMGKSLCAAPAAHPTLPKWAWTMNRWAVEGSVNDTYRFHPWRAPGTAPVADACGMAGGSPSIGGGAAVFSSTPFAKQGDLGSHVLPRSAPQVTWKAGGVVEVAWGIRANHGGGYQYRLCPASEPLTEACFQQTPLKFVGKQKLRYVDGSETAPFEPTLVSEGVVPAGAAWMMNPVPRIDFDSVNSGQPQAWKECRPGEQTYDTSFPMSLACRQFEPAACKERTRMHGMPWAPIPGKPYPTGDVQGECSGDFVSALIVDHVEVPRTLPPGEYVLGWRWDCEETAQVWSSCADVAVVAGAELDYAASR